jgi:hypothetical protein
VGGRPAAEAASAADRPAGDARLKRGGARAAGVAAIAGYLAIVAACEVTRRAAGFPEPSDVALTPAALAAGKAWLLVTSAFLVSGPPLAELAGLALAAAVLVRRRGPGAFWRAGIGGHVGGTLVVYAAIGVLWILARGAVDDLVDVRDYGVSGVWLGVLGAIFADLLRDARRRPLRGSEQLALASAAAAGAIGVAFFGRLSGAEHGCAFAIGAGLQTLSQKGHD